MGKKKTKATRKHAVPKPVQRGWCSFFCRMSVYIVAFIAIVIGLFVSGIPGQMGLYRYLDNLETEGNLRLLGMSPLLHRDVEFGFDMENVKDGSLVDQTFVVTGANIGLGYWTTYHLASKGGDVVMACRSETKCETARKEIITLLASSKVVGTIACMRLDLGSFKSISNFSKKFEKMYSGLNSLILNAGIMAVPFGLTVDGIEKQIGVNHFGHFYLTQQLLNILEKTAAQTGRSTTVAVVSSSAHYQSYPEGVKLSLKELNNEDTYSLMKAYGQSKLSNLLFAQELSARVSKKNILVNTIHPGIVATNLAAHIFDTIENKYSISLDFLTDLIGKIAWHPKIASYTQLYVAISDQVINEKITGKYFHPIARENGPCARHSKNMTLQKGLWEMTENIVEKIEKTLN